MNSLAEMDQESAIKSTIDEIHNTRNSSIPTSTDRTELTVIKPKFIIRKKGIKNIKSNIQIDIGSVQTQEKNDRGTIIINL